VQLVGKVIRVGPRTSFVRLLTDLTAGTIDGRIMSSAETPGPICKHLSPVGGRKLQARVRVEKDQTAPEEGQIVRLLDDRWPRNAQMLVIGVIAEKPTVDSTGWYVVTVKPTLDLERLSEVLLRIAAPETEDKGPAPSTDGSGP
jgi:cell shape-determining protein MreC